MTNIVIRFFLHEFLVFFYTDANFTSIVAHSIIIQSPNIANCRYTSTPCFQLIRPQFQKTGSVLDDPTGKEPIQPCWIGQTLHRIHLNTSVHCKMLHVYSSTTHVYNSLARYCCLFLSISCLTLQEAKKSIYMRSLMIITNINHLYYLFIS